MAGGAGYSTFSEVGRLTKERVNKGRQGKSFGLDLGLPKFNHFLGGLQKETQILLGGEPKSGKSSFANRVFLFNPLYSNLARETPYKIIVNYFSFEMRGYKQMLREVSYLVWKRYNVRLDVDTLMSKRNILNSQHATYAEEMIDYLSQFDIRMYDLSLTNKQVKNVLYETSKEIGRWENSRFIADDSYWLINIYDHTRLGTPDGESSELERIGDLSRLLFSFRNSCASTNIILSQYSRSIDSLDRKSSGHEPMLSDFFGASSTQQDADIVLALSYPSRHRVYNYRGYKVNEIHNLRPLAILANRDGDSDVHLAYTADFEVSNWIELPKASEMVYEG